MGIIDVDHGNLIEADAEALVNTVNCVGVMGKGIALQFRQAFPENFRQYASACRNGQVNIGQMFITETHLPTSPKYIINFPTKRHWKGKSRLEDIESGLIALADEISRLDIKSIAIPPLGCGNGGLDWLDVKPRIEAALASIPAVNIFLFTPKGAPDAKVVMPVTTDKPDLTRARAILIQLLDRYGVPGYELTLLEVQKLAYFLQVSGEEMKLEYEKNKYGPYAETLHYVLQRLEGHYLRGYGDRSQQSLIVVLPEAIIESNEIIKAVPEARERLNRVSSLIEGFETPYGMELLATVHWVAQHTDKKNFDLEETVREVHAWDKRKRDTFKPTHISIALNRLSSEGWVNAAENRAPPAHLVQTSLYKIH